jgi:RNA polymerase sigma-70 factor (ECF subfamily)
MNDARALVDEQLLTRIRARHHGTIDTIVRQQSRRLYRAARGMGLPKSDAEDVVQDVFVTFMASVDRFEGRAQVGTWLFGILRHKVQERRRSVARDEVNDPVDTLFEAQFDAGGGWIHPPVAPDRLLISRRAHEAIQECLSTLPHAQRDVFTLRQVEELSAGDVSKISGYTVTHVGVLLHRARLRLRLCLEGRGWGATP